MLETKSLNEIFVMLAALAVIIFSLLHVRAASANESVPFIKMEEFFRNPESSSWSISPDGTRLAFMKPWERRMNVFVRDIATGEETRVTSATERNVGGYFWKGSDRIVYAQDKGGDENYHVYIVDIKTLAARDLTPFDGVRASVLDDLEDDPEHMLLDMNLRNREVFEVFRCTLSDLAAADVKLDQENISDIKDEDLAKLGLVRIAENPGDITGWMTDHDGKLRIAERTDGVNTTLLYRTTEDQDFRELITTDFHDDFSPLLFTYDNKKLYVASNLNRDKEAIYEFDPEANETGELIFENSEVDVGSLLHSKKRKIITAATYVTDRRHYHFFDDERKNLQSEIEAFFPESDYDVIVADMDDDETRCIIGIGSDKTRGSYYFYDRSSKKFEKLADISPWLDEKNMASMTPVTYQSRDGLTIHGYLTVPAGCEARDLPMVVIPHGGPSARDYWGFDSEAQFLANRGAAVLQVNFRGSTGYGKEFWTAGFKQWGRAMQNDVTDGAEWAVKQGIADPKRLAIYGGSYGGYAALAGATFTPDLYACAVSYVGPSNIFTLLETIPPYWKPMIDMEYETIGDPVKDKELLTEISPVFHADQIKIPLFVAQGANDPRVNKAESDQIVEAVRKRGQDVVYMVKDNEGHGFHNEENRFDFYHAMEEFFQKHLGLRAQ